MAVTRISDLPSITTVTVDDNIIVNDANAATTRITFANFMSSVSTQDITFSGDITFTQPVSGISITELSDVDTTTTAPVLNQVLQWNGANWTPQTFTPVTSINDLSDVDTATTPPTDGQVLMWIAADSEWAPRNTSGSGGAAVDSVNGQTGVVVLNADDIDDTGTDHKFATAAQLTLADSALQTGDNVSELTNDAGYISSNAVDSVNGESGVVVLDADDIDDTSTTHKFATSTQLNLAETAIQPTSSIDALADVDTSTTAPVDGQVMVWSEADSEWKPGDIGRTSWNVTNNGAIAYNFEGPGFAGTEDNPTIYLTRGQKYNFVVAGSAHPLRIQSTSGDGGTLYNDGITNNPGMSDTLEWDVRMDSPDTLYYQCANHSVMNGIIYILDESGSATSSFTVQPNITRVNPTAVDQGQLWTATQLVDQEYPGIAWYFYNYSGPGATNTTSVSGTVGGIENTPGTYTVNARAAWPFGISEAVTITVTINSFTLTRDTMFGGDSGMQFTHDSGSTSNYNYLAITGAVVDNGDGSYTWDETGANQAEALNSTAFYSYTDDVLVAFMINSSNVVQGVRRFLNVTAIPQQGEDLGTSGWIFMSSTAQNTAAIASSVNGKRVPVGGYYLNGLGGTHYLDIAAAGTELNGFGSTTSDWSYGFVLTDDWVASGTFNQLLSPTGSNYFVNTIGAFGIGSSPYEYVVYGNPTSGPFSSSSTGTSWNISTDNWVIGSAGDLVVVTFEDTTNTWRCYVEGVLKVSSTSVSTYMDSTTTVTNVRLGDITDANVTQYPEDYSELGGWYCRLDSIFIANGFLADQTAVTNLVANKADLTAADDYADIDHYATFNGSGVTVVKGGGTYTRGDVNPGSASTRGLPD